jgi:putative transcriptional regulator
VELSNKIRKFRFENGEMTQKQLAERVSVSRQTLNAIENCNHAPKIDVAIRIADVFGVSVDQMFEFEYDGKPERRSVVSAPVPAQPAPSMARAPDSDIERVEPAQQAGHCSTKRGEKKEVSLADLRNIIG